MGDGEENQEKPKQMRLLAGVTYSPVDLVHYTNLVAECFGRFDQVGIRFYSHTGELGLLLEKGTMTDRREQGEVKEIHSDKFLLTAIYFTDQPQFSTRELNSGSEGILYSRLRKVFKKGEGEVKIYANPNLGGLDLPLHYIDTTTFQFEFLRKSDEAERDETRTDLEIIVDKSEDTVQGAAKDEAARAQEASAQKEAAEEPKD